MAESKNSFVMYADWQKIFSALKKNERADLIDLIFSYVNDENPKDPKGSVLIAWIPIKAQFKRDLKGWEAKKGTKSESGILGNLKRWHPDLYIKVLEGKLDPNQASQIAKDRKTSQCDNLDRGATECDRTVSQEVANVAVTVTDTVTDTVNVTESEEAKKTHDLFPNQIFMIDPKELKNSSQIDVIGINLKIPKEKMLQYLDSFLKDRENDQRKYRGMPGLLNHFSEHCQLKHNGKVWQSPQQTSKPSTLISGKPQ